MPGSAFGGLLSFAWPKESNQRKCHPAASALRCASGYLRLHSKTGRFVNSRFALKQTNRTPSRFRLQPKLRRRGRPVPPFSPEGGRRRTRSRSDTTLSLTCPGSLVATPSSAAEARVVGEHCLRPKGELRSRALRRAAQGSPSRSGGPAHRVAFFLVTFSWPNKKK